MYCTECKKACDTKTIDDGIGSYEFWGQTGTHHDYWEGSVCCEAPVQEEMPEDWCPGCGDVDLNETMPALSRQDNHTLICPACGTLEAMHDFIDNVIKELPSV